LDLLVPDLSNNMRLLRSVAIEEWILAESIGERKDRLLSGTTPGELLSRVVEEGLEASRTGLISLNWQESSCRRGHFRLMGRVPLGEGTFDQLFNGRSGYRAQYYLSPEEGVLYNRDLLDRLLPAIEISYSRHPLDVSFDLIELSLGAPHAKLCVWEERVAFDDAAADTVNPPRWVANGATRGRRAPLPAHLTLDVKGIKTSRG
jgi:hypothetical protein